MATVCNANVAGLDWDGVLSSVNHVIHLLETIGPSAISLAKSVMLGIKAATNRDLAGVFAALNAATDDVREIVAAIKAEFNL